MIRLLAFAIIILSGVFSGCKRQKWQKSTVPTLETNTYAFKTVDVLSDSVNIQTDFVYMTTKSKISIRSKKQNIDNANVAFRIKKDSAIWMSSSVMGLEVIRSIISRDGVKMIDRMNKVYTEASYYTLASRLGFPLDYSLIQGFFLADVPVYTGQRFELQQDGQNILVRQSDQYLAIYNLIDQLTRKTTRMEATDQMTGNKAHASYDNMHPAEKGLIPYLVNLNLSAQASAETDKSHQLEISVIHNSVTLTDSTLSFPFQIPNNYKKAF